MESFYIALFVVFTTICVSIKYYTRIPSNVSTNKQFQRLQMKYLIAFYLFKLADWCQGPYFYDVYQHKKWNGETLSDTLVGALFLCGFLSSMIFGTFVGGWVDRLGRKKGCQIYCGLYTLAALSTYADNYFILISGRICGGISTSLLFSAPEAWLIGEHKAGGYPEEWINHLFGWVFFGDSIMAIIAGFICQPAANNYGYSGPFFASAIILIIALVYITIDWTENYGDKNVVGTTNFSDAWKVCKERKVFTLGMIQSLFEGSMYVFVLLYVPILRESSKESGDLYGEPPIGNIFSIYMIGCMIGSSLFSMALGRNWTIMEIARVVFIIASSSIGCSILLKNYFVVVLMCYILFESTVGSYYPCIGSMRSIIVPEKVRSTVMNFYRIPLNLFVILAFLNIDKLGHSGTMFVATLGLCGCFVGQQMLMNWHKYSEVSHGPDSDEIENDDKK